MITRSGLSKLYNQEILIVQPGQPCPVQNVEAVASQLRQLVVPVSAGHCPARREEKLPDQLTWGAQLDLPQTVLQ